MGNGSSGKPIQLHGKAKLAASKFDLDEIHVLHKTWQDMSDRSNGKGKQSHFICFVTISFWRHFARLCLKVYSGRRETSSTEDKSDLY